MVKDKAKIQAVKSTHLHTVFVAWAEQGHIGRSFCGCSLRSLTAPPRSTFQDCPQQCGESLQPSVRLVSSCVLGVCEVFFGSPCRRQLLSVDITAPKAELQLQWSLGGTARSRLLAPSPLFKAEHHQLVYWFPRFIAAFLGHFILLSEATRAKNASLMWIQSKCTQIACLIFSFYLFSKQ